MAKALYDLERLDEKGEKARIGVMGDAMIDEYYNVRVKKISPEFPIPVMHSETSYPNTLPGGAANVAHQFKYWNVDARLMAFTNDYADQVFSSHQISTSLCVSDNRIQVPLKRRFYSDDFPTYRWDVEKAFYGLHPQEADRQCYALYNKALANLQDVQVVIFSDYDKGVFTKYQEMLIPELPISIVDPKGKNIDKWRGCTVFKPNAAEALALSGRKTVHDAGLWLRDRLGCKAVVITEAANGVTLVQKGVDEIRPTKPLPVVESVIGAGDCFVALLALALARGMEMRDAVQAAWEAGCLYVQNRHNKPVSRLDAYRSYDRSVGKIVHCLSEIPAKQDRKFKLVFTNGCFDILHSGHLETLRFAKSKGDKLVVGVNSDVSVSGLKPGRPILPLDERMKLLAALEDVDYVISFDEPDPLRLIQAVDPDVLVKGGDWEVQNIVGANVVQEVYTSPLVAGLSTTAIVEKIKATNP